MKTSFSYKQPGLHRQVGSEVELQLSKIERLLKRYAPDLVQLHGSFERIPHKNSFALSLNLSLPSGTLHATGEGADIRQSVRAAFMEVASQVKKHQSRLRKDYEWKRKRERRGVSREEKATI